jgi:hypothetical protein
MICNKCGREDEAHESGLCDSCEMQENYDKLSEYAVVIDEGYHAALLRDLCRAEAQKCHIRWSRATNRAAMQRNLQRHEIFAKYAERFEHIRKEEAARVAATLR